MSYFRPQNARKIAPRSVCSLPNSTQKVSRKGGRVRWISAKLFRKHGKQEEVKRTEPFRSLLFKHVWQPPIKQFRMPGFLGHVRWAPKGDALQYLQTKDGATNLWEQRLEGGRPRQLTHFSVGQIFDFDWSHDQKRLLFTRGQVTRDVVLIENFRTSH